MEVLYSIDDIVHFMDGNRPHKGEVTKINISKNNVGDHIVIYEIESKLHRKEGDIFSSKEELKNHVFKD